MDYAPLRSPNEATTALPDTIKFVIAGGFGVGKTTFIRSVSEIDPLQTEEVLTEASSNTDSLSGIEYKNTTTVAFDFGRRTLIWPRNIEIMIFGTPGQPRFQFTWDELTYGAAGAVILADTRRIEDSWNSVYYFERSGKQFIIAVNQFDDAAEYEVEEVRTALNLSPDIPILLSDARDAASSFTVLRKLLEHALAVREKPSNQGVA